jgi:magnesium chelatase family protein
LLVAAMNPCACGNWGNPRASCRCTTDARLRYLARISGPLLDRIDLHVVVPPADLKAWQRPATPGDWNTETARLKVNAARARQAARQAAAGLCAATNSSLTLPELESVAAPEAEGRALLDLAIDRQQLSARSYVRVLRIARTLADLDDSAHVRALHVGEALRYRINDLANC